MNGCLRKLAYVYNLLKPKFLCCFYARLCDVASGNTSTHFISPKYIKAPSLKKMTFFSPANALFFLIVCSSADTVSVVGGRLVGLLINFFFTWGSSLSHGSSLVLYFIICWGSSPCHGSSLVIIFGVKARASLLFYNLLRLEPLSWLEPRYYFWSWGSSPCRGSSLIII